MSGETLYHRACGMLRTTNVYSQPIENLRFIKNDKTYSLLDMLKKNTDYGKRADNRRITISEKQGEAFRGICESLVEYVQEYPASYSVKQGIYKKFIDWMKEIKARYNIEVDNQELAEYTTGRSVDTVVEMLQILQEPAGVTKEDIAQMLHISERAVLKNLCRLDHSLGESKQSKEVPYIAGQPVGVKIKAFRVHGKTEHRYRIVNTLHPIVLQENLMQAGTLIQALARNYKVYGNDISYVIGLDIWSQLTKYARAKIRAVYSYGDSDVKGFIEILEEDYPGADMACAYLPERDMLNSFSVSNKEKLGYLAKSGSRRCNLKLYIDESIQSFESVSIRQEGNGVETEVAYKAICPGGKEILFMEAQVIDIEEL